MKKAFSTAILLAFTLLAFSKSPMLYDHFEQLMQIDSTDTVVIDLSLLQTVGGKSTFPVSISTDDAIYALDFSIKYNTNNLQIDSVIDLTNYMQSYYFFNSNDTTWRFTSSSMTLQPYDINTSLVRIQFNLFAPQITAGDLYEIKGYLNGTECSIKIINPTSGINDLENSGKIVLYPNPATTSVTITTEKNVQLQIMTITGTIISNEITNHNGITELNISDLANGVYFLKISDNTSSLIKTFIKCDQ